ncbi:MAG: type II toxin-antitoxin system VapC family toxin [Candidatus Micrarchaeia archaeon]
MIFADTSAIIAYFCPDDERHLSAKNLLGNVQETIIISDHVLDETITFIARRYDSNFAYAVGKKIFSSKETLLQTATMEDLNKALETVKKHRKMSFCDALSVIIMQNNKIKKILSYDSDFDYVKGIQRIH